MDHLTLQKNAFEANEEMRGSVSIFDQKNPIFCPKPRRVGLLSNNPMRHLRWHQPEACDSKAGVELLDIILMKEGYGVEHSSTQVASSPPPYFCGSPPSRSANPLIQDVRFGDDKLTQTQMSPYPISSPSGVSSPSRKGGCSRIKFGLKPAAVRVEGFDCLSRDRQNSRIPAVA